MKCKIDWFEVEFVFRALGEEGNLTSEALSQRIARCLKGGDKDLYITLKVAQSLFYYDRKKPYED